MTEPLATTLDLERLGFADRFLLWAVRLWARGFRGDEAVRGRLEDAFDMCHAPRAVEALDDLLLSLAAGTLRSIEINCPCCREISVDEVALLSWIGDLQRGDAARVERELAALLRPGVVPAARRHVERLSESLAHAGLELRPRPVGHVAILPPDASRTLH